jgi:phage terminase large subunit-like protein
VLIDDPVKNRREAESRVLSQANWEWFTSTAVTRLTPDGSMVVCHTRWSEHDLIGRLCKETEKYRRSGGLEGERWEHVNLPALAKHGDGPALCPELWTREALLGKRRGVGEYDWSALYQGEPRPRGAKLFAQEPDRVENPSRSDRRVIIGVDVAGTASTSAHWTVAVVFAFRGRGEKLQADVLEVVRMQETIPVVCRKLEALQARYGAPLVVEGSGIGKAVPQTLLDTNPKLRLTVVHPVTDKWSRSQAYAAAWNQGRVRIRTNPTREEAEFIRVHMAFTGVNDPEDDDVDAGAHAWNFALGIVGILPPGDASNDSGLRMGEGRGYDEDDLD